MILCLFFGSKTNFCGTQDERESRIINSLYWGALGDALGAPVEFIQNINEILKKPEYSSDFLDDNYESVVKASKKY